MSQELRHKDIEETLDKYIYGIYENLDEDRKNHIETICPFLVNTNVSGTTTKKRGACVLKFKDNYGILDVPGDGACFYHCMRLVRGLIQMKNSNFIYHFDDVVSLKGELFDRMKEITEPVEFQGTVIMEGDLNIMKYKVLRYLGRITPTNYEYVKSIKVYIQSVFEGHRTSNFVEKTHEILKLLKEQTVEAGNEEINLGSLEYYFFLIMVTLFDIVNGTEIMNEIGGIDGTDRIIGTETTEISREINYDVLITCLHATMREDFYHAVGTDISSVIDMEDKNQDTYYNDEFIFREHFGLCGGSTMPIPPSDYQEDEIDSTGKVIDIKMRADPPPINFYTLTPSFNKEKCKQYFILFNTGGHYQIMMNVTAFRKHQGNPLKALYHSIIHESGAAEDSGSIILKGTRDFGGDGPDIELKPTKPAEPTDTKLKEPNSFIIKSYGRQVGEIISPGDELFKSLFPQEAAAPAGAANPAPAGAANPAPAGAEGEGAAGKAASEAVREAERQGAEAGQGGEVRQEEPKGLKATIQLKPIQLPTGDDTQPDPKPKPRPRLRAPAPISYSKFQYVKGKPLEVRDFSFLTSRYDIQMDGITLYNLRFQESRRAPGKFTFVSLPQPTSIFYGGEQKLVFETGEQHKFRISTYEDFYYLFLKHLIVRIEHNKKYVYQNWYTLLADYTFPDNSKLPTLTGLKGFGGKIDKCIPIIEVLRLSADEQSFAPIKAAIKEMFNDATLIVTKFGDT